MMREDSFQCLTVAGQQRNPNSDPEVGLIRHPALRGATSKETKRNAALMKEQASPQVTFSVTSGNDGPEVESSFFVCSVWSR